MGRKKKNTTGTARRQPADLADRQPRALHGRRRHGPHRLGQRVAVKIEWADGEKVTWKRDVAGGPAARNPGRGRRRRPDLSARGHRRRRGERRSNRSGATRSARGHGRCRADRHDGAGPGESEIMPTTAEQPQEEPESTTATAEPTATEAATPTEQPATRTGGGSRTDGGAGHTQR